MSCWRGRTLGLILLILCAVGLPACGHHQTLTAIVIQPSTETFGSTTTPVIENQGSSVKLRALGTYIHPPATKDITAMVTWSSNTPDMITVDSTGLITATGFACGSTLVSATVETHDSHGSIVTGYMTASVICPTAN